MYPFVQRTRSNGALRNGRIVNELRSTLTVMGTEARKIFEQVLILSEEERAALADALYDTLKLDQCDLSPEWIFEISRHMEALERGESQIIPWLCKP